MSYRNIVAWQKSMDFVVEVYKFSENLPSREQYGLGSQIQRASVAIASNIAEGYGRSSKADYARFVDIALGSTREVQTQLEICERLGYGECKVLQRQAEEIAKILFGLLKSLRT